MSENIPCDNCNGFGYQHQLLISMPAIRALAEANINKPVPTKKIDCKKCYGSGKIALTLTEKP